MFPDAETINLCVCHLIVNFLASGPPKQISTHKIVTVPFTQSKKIPTCRKFLINNKHPDFTVVLIFDQLVYVMNRLNLH